MSAYTVYRDSVRFNECILFILMGPHYFLFACIFILDEVFITDPINITKLELSSGNENLG